MGNHLLFITLNVNIRRHPHMDDTTQLMFMNDYKMPIYHAEPCWRSSSIKLQHAILWKIMSSPSFSA